MRIINTLLNIWYILSSIIGAILVFVSFMLIIFGIVLVFSCLFECIKTRDWSDLKFIGISCLITISIPLFTYWINLTIPKDNYIVSEEIPNIQSYDGLGNEKSGKYINSYYYFKQGVNNDYIEYKVSINKTHRHETNEKTRVVKNHTEYISPFRGFSIFSLEDNEYYDIYIPKEK